MKYIMHILLWICLYSCTDESQVKKQVEGAILPSFNLLLTDSTTIVNTSNIPVGKPIVLFYFMPDCPFCQALTQEIISTLDTYKDVRFFILTSFSFQDLKNYYRRYQLAKYPNITVGRDYRFYFQNYFKPTKVPYIVVYDRNKRFKQVLIGKVSTDLIKNTISE